MEKTYSDTRQFTIKQLSEKLEIPKPTLRFWEKELDGIIVPMRTSGGQRRYTESHILILEKIKRLRSSGKSIPEIKDHFNNGRNSNAVDDRITDIETLTERITEAVKAEVAKFFNMKE